MSAKEKQKEKFPSSFKLISLYFQRVKGPWCYHAPQMKFFVNKKYVNFGNTIHIYNQWEGGAKCTKKTRGK